MTTRTTHRDRYRFVRVDGDGETLAIIHDIECDTAWIQSTAYTPVER